MESADFPSAGDVRARPRRWGLIVALCASALVVLVVMHWRKGGDGMYPAVVVAKQVIPAHDEWVDVDDSEWEGRILHTRTYRVKQWQPTTWWVTVKADARRARVADVQDRITVDDAFFDQVAIGEPISAQLAIDRISDSATIAWLCVRRVCSNGAVSK